MKRSSGRSLAVPRILFVKECPYLRRDGGVRRGRDLAWVSVTIWRRRGATIRTWFFKAMWTRNCCVRVRRSR